MKPLLILVLVTFFVGFALLFASRSKRTRGDADIGGAVSGDSGGAASCDAGGGCDGGGGGD